MGDHETKVEQMKHFLKIQFKDELPRGVNQWRELGVKNAESLMKKISYKAFTRAKLLGWDYETALAGCMKATIETVEDAMGISTEWDEEQKRIYLWGLKEQES